MGGHGVFTYALLQGLEGGAARDSDGVIRASQLIDYVHASYQSKRVLANIHE